MLGGRHYPSPPCIAVLLPPEVVRLSRVQCIAFLETGRSQIRVVGAVAATTNSQPGVSGDC